MWLSVLTVACLFLFASAAWFVEPLGMPDGDVAEAGIVTGVVMLLAGIGAWLVVLGLAPTGERQ
jgi:hypothetical protein